MDSEKPVPVFEMRVYGTPQQRGSKNPIALKNKDGSAKRRANGSIIVICPDDNKKSGDWMTEVRMTAGALWRGDLISEELVLEATFWFARPKSHYGTGKNAGKLKPTAPKHYGQVPDLSKLVRCLEDGLTKVVYVDDRLIEGYGEVKKKWTTGSACAEVRLYRSVDWERTEENDHANDLFSRR